MADEAKATEWPRSKFLHGSVKKISGTATGHNENDSKHSRVCHDCISVNPLFIGGLGTSVCIFRILHLAVFSQFYNLITYAEMVERSITAVLKTVEARVSGGSNPSLRAKNR